MSNFTEFHQRVIDTTGLRTQVELAEFLGIRQSSISDAERRDSVPSEWLLTLFFEKSLNPSWLLTGDGSMYLTGADGTPVAPEQPLHDSTPTIVPYDPNHKTPAEASGCMCRLFPPYTNPCLPRNCMFWTWTKSDRSVGICIPRR